MSRAKVLVPVLLVVGGILAILLWPRAPLPSSVPVAASAIALYGYGENGQLTWELTARDGQLIDNEGTLSAVSLRFLSEGSLPLTATAETLLRGTRESQLSGSVLVEREDGLQLQTDQLTWVESEKTLESQFVSLTYHDIEAEAGQLNYDIPSQLATLSGGVEVRLERESAYVIRGDRAEESGGTISVLGDVVIETGEAVYRCQRLDTNAEGETVRLTGAVDAALPGLSLTSEQAEVSPDGLRASGRVSIQLELAVLEGDHGT